MRNLNGLANHLIHEGLLTENMAEYASNMAQQRNISFITYIVKNNILSSDAIFQSCKKIFGLLTVNLEECSKYLSENLLSPEIIKHHRVVAISKENNILNLGIADPTDIQTLNIIQFHTDLTIQPILVREDELDKWIQTHYPENQTEPLQLEFIKNLSQDESLMIQENIINYDEPLIKFVDHLILHARQQSASDIHIEPFEKCCRIRYRQDGILYLISEIPLHLAIRLATRLKVMAKLNIAERRLPQDGRFHCHQTDIRMNTCPTLFGEKIVLRLLDTNKSTLDISQLGFTEKQHTLFIDKISQPQGLILVTGPTGSGKTTTLYSALQYLNHSEKNISSAEDPIEIQINGINQVAINPKINFDYATALRSFLRQDPDILMVGEIRDYETADIAIQAAQTGHLVLSTLHTNSAVETLSRLQLIGIPIYNLINSISLIVAQRLIRKLCNVCKQPEKKSIKMLKNLNLPEESYFYRAVGCTKCLKGYQGRLGIYEILVMTEEISSLFSSHTHPTIFLSHLKQTGFDSLYDSGLKKVMDGTTSLTELNRVLNATPFS